MKKTFIIFTFIAIFCPAIVHAIEFSDYIRDFKSGFSHPVLGFDHLLAMIAVGILSAQIGGRAIWTVPATFVSVMTVGGVVGIYEIEVPFVEYGISFSVVALGASIAAAHKFPTILAMLFVGIFAFFHGHAHGMEMPWMIEPAIYALGFMSATTALHIAGVFIGLGSVKIKGGKVLLQLSGVVISCIGIYMMNPDMFTF